MTSDPWLIARFERLAAFLYWSALVVALVGLAARLLGLPIIGPTGGRLPQPWGVLLLVSGTIAARQGLLRQPAPAWSKNVLAATALASLAALVTVLLGDSRALPSWVLMVSEESRSRFDGLPAPNLALVILLSVTGALMATTGKRALRFAGQGANALAGVIILTVLVGTAYGDSDAAGFPFDLAEAAILLAVSAFLMVLAVLSSRPAEGLLRPMITDGAGGVLLRRLVPAVLLLPPTLIGLLVLRARFDVPGILAVMAVAFTVVMLAGLFATAREIDRLYGGQQHALEQADRATAALTQVAPVISDLDRALSLVEVNQVDRIRVAARYSASTGLLAGDSLAVFPIGVTAIGVVLVDAAGHGAQPALQALRLRDSLAQAIRLDFAPHEAISSVAWLVDGPADMATVAVAVADGSTGKVKVALAGHPPPLLDHKGHMSQLPTGGPLLHRDVSGTWWSEELELVEGDRLVLFTDGVADVFPRAAHGDGFQELAAFLQRLGPADVETTADACMSFASRDQGRSDDRAVVVLEVSPPRTASSHLGIS